MKRKTISDLWNAEPFLLAFWLATCRPFDGCHLSDGLNSCVKFILTPLRFATLPLEKVPTTYFLSKHSKKYREKKNVSWHGKKGQGHQQHPAKQTRNPSSFLQKPRWYTALYLLRSLVIAMLRGLWGSPFQQLLLWHESAWTRIITPTK